MNIVILKKLNSENLKNFEEEKVKDRSRQTHSQSELESRKRHKDDINRTKIISDCFVVTSILLLVKHFQASFSTQME